MPAIELDQADFQSALPEQHLHVYFDDEELGLNAGVWTTTDMQEAFGPYPGDEFMVILEGKVAMMDADGISALHQIKGQTPDPFKAIKYAKDLHEKISEQ